MTTDQEKYIQNLETIVVVLLTKLNNEVTVSIEELEQILPNLILDVQDVDGGIKFSLIEDK